MRFAFSFLLGGDGGLAILAKDKLMKYRLDF